MKILGFPGLVELAPALEYRKNQGWITTRTWQGPDAAARQFLSIIQQEGTATEARMTPFRQGQPATVTATFDGADDQAEPENQVESSWTMGEGDSTQDLWNHRKVVEMFKAYDLEDMVRIRQIAVRMASGEYPTDEGSLLPVAELLFQALLQIPDYQEFSKRLIRENLQPTYYDPKVILRHTLVGPQQWKFTYNWDDRSKLITSEQIIELEPSLYLDLPPLKWWQIRQPQVEQMSNGKLQVVREWHEIDSDSWKYDLYIPEA